MQKWTELYHEAMTESNSTRLPLLLDNAIDAVLDQIEDTLSRPNRQVGDLTTALNDLRSRRKEVDALKSPRTPLRHKAA